MLRYSPYSKAVTEVIRSGALGPLINVVHIEPVGFYHFAHSYVRGNWAREADSCFSLMTKSCQCVPPAFRCSSITQKHSPPSFHLSSDLDIMCHWLHPGGPTRVSSFGSLQHFRKDKKPAQARDAKRCLDCAHERDCAYSAKKGACAARAPFNGLSAPAVSPL